MLMSERDIKKLSKIDLVREAKIVANVFLHHWKKSHLEPLDPSKFPTPSFFIGF